MIEYQPLFQRLVEANLEAWAQQLPAQIDQAIQHSQHGDLPRWLQTIQQLPLISDVSRDFTSDQVRVGQQQDLPISVEQLTTLLQELHPWRKGPYDIFGIHIDTEWRSDWKWSRVEPHITPLHQRLVLDVGCGNGYHCWRMLGAGARTVVGIDPTLLSVIQFQAFKRMAGDADVFVLPLGIEELPYGLKAFDTVFSMGVLYHRRSPLDHLLELRDSLRPGGELILETLIIEGDTGATLLPPQRYAKMRNVWFLPSCETLIAWMQRCGFINVRLVDVNQTTVQEQRSTEWMRFHSLADFLDPENPELTAEGLPAPRRAIIIANTP